MTSLTERYLAATLRGIPEKQRPDVERELRSSIADAVEDRVAAGEDRIAAETAVLEGLGEPDPPGGGNDRAAEYLIGPELFSAYRYILFLLLGIVVPIVGVVEALVEINGGAGIGAALLVGIGGALTVGVHVAFWVTLSFAVVERVDRSAWKDSDLKQLYQPWTVEHLPELPSSGAVSVGETVGEIVTLGISIGGLLYLRGWSWVTDASGDPIPLFDPALSDFWFPALIAVLAAHRGLPHRQARGGTVDDRPRHRACRPADGLRAAVRRPGAEWGADQPRLRRSRRLATAGRGRRGCDAGRGGGDLTHQWLGGRERIRRARRPQPAVEYAQ